MNDQGTHCQHSALPYHARDWRYLSRQMCDIVIAHNALLVSLGENSQRTILQLGVVEVDTKGKDLTKSTCRRMGIDHAGFHRPRSPSMRLAFLAKWQGGILMPNDEPVNLGRFVKKGSVERYRFRAQNPLCEVEQ